MEYIYHGAKTSTHNAATHRATLENYCTLLQKRFNAAAHRSKEEREELENYELSEEFKRNW